MRKSGRGARGSSKRARRVRIVVIDRFTEIDDFSGDSLQQIQIAQHLIRFRGDGNTQARTRSAIFCRIDRVTPNSRSAG